MPNRTNNPLEKHIQTILVSLITAGILWIGMNVVDLKTNLNALQSSVNELKTDAQTTKGDHYELGDLQRRVEVLERKK